jgi:hypothetical protein
MSWKFFGKSIDNTPLLIETPAVLEEVEGKSFVFEFYDELKSYVVLPRGSWRLA